MNNKTKKSKPALGRPKKELSEWQKNKAFELAGNGKSIGKIALMIGVSRSCLYELMKRDEEFKDALNRWREFADERVEASLYERACGYQHEETKVVVADGVVEEIQMIKHYPPSEKAAEFWLKNRQGHKWKEKIEHIHKVEDLTDEELEAEVEKLMKEKKK